MKLSDNEIKVLDSMPNGGDMTTKAYIVWNRGQGIEFGPCRHAIGCDLTERQFSVSPFPGAWIYINQKEILAVRHVDAMQ